MITQRTILTQMEISEGRAVIAHFQRIIEDNGAVIARSNPHTVCFMPDADRAAMLDAVNDNIARREDMQWPPIPAGEWQRAVDVCNAVHTAEVRAAYEAWKSAQASKT